MLHSLMIALVLAPTADDWYARAVKSVAMTVTPAEALPGQVVTLKLTITLNDTYHTYPLTQPDRKAVDMVNQLQFAADAAGLIPVGKIADPSNPTKKAEPLLGIREMHIHGGVVTFEQKAVVSPKATAGGKTAATKKLILMVCDENNCYPAKTMSVDAKWTVKSGPGEAVPEAHRAEVEAVINPKK